MDDTRIQIIKLPPERWNEYKALRLRALKDDPQAFGSSYTKEVAYSDDKWRERTNNSVLFATDGNNLVGMLGVWQSEGDKENKTANIFGVFELETRTKGNKQTKQNLFGFSYSKLAIANKAKQMQETKANKW